MTVVKGTEYSCEYYVAQSAPTIRRRHDPFYPSPFRETLSLANPPQRSPFLPAKLSTFTTWLPCRTAAVKSSASRNNLDSKPGENFRVTKGKQLPVADVIIGRRFNEGVANRTHSRSTNKDR